MPLTVTSSRHPATDATVRPVTESVRVARVAPGLVWRAFDGELAVGAARASLRPDNRWRIWFDECRADCYQPLLAAVAANTGADLYATAGEANAQALARYASLGFTENRRESMFLIPADPAVNGLSAGIPPGEFVIKSAIDVDEDQLRLLDEALREDVPGSDGWHWDPGDFHEETFSDDFDPATYLVAIDTANAEFAGLVRIWISPGRPRLGLIGVLRGYRRAGLARALLGRAFTVLHERGVSAVTAEVDDTNAAALALMESLGAKRTGGMVELVSRRDL